MTPTSPDCETRLGPETWNRRSGAAETRRWIRREAVRPEGDFRDQIWNECCEWIANHMPPEPASMAGALQAYMEIMRWAENERRELLQIYAPDPLAQRVGGAIETLTRVIDKARQMAEWTEKQG